MCSLDRLDISTPVAAGTLARHGRHGSCAVFSEYGVDCVVLIIDLISTIGRVRDLSGCLPPNVASLNSKELVFFREVVFLGWLLF